MIPGEPRSTVIAGKAKSAASRGHAVAFVGGLLVPLGVFAALAAVFAGRGARGWDADILRFSDRYYRTSVAGPLEEVLKVGIGVGGAIAVGVVAVLVAKRRWRQALFWVLAVGGILAFDPLLKEIFHRPQLGDHGGDYSFPSGNAMASVAIVAAIAHTCSPRWRRPVLVLGVPFVIVYGAALVYQWWHYPSDVVAGWCVALAWLTALWLVLPRAARDMGSSPARTGCGQNALAGPPTSRAAPLPGREARY